MVDCGYEDVVEPLPGKPGLSGAGVGKGIGEGHDVGSEDLFAVADVPAGIGVGEQARAFRTEQEGAQDAEKEDVGDRRERPANPEGLGGQGWGGRLTVGVGLGAELLSQMKLPHLLGCR